MDKMIFPNELLKDAVTRAREIETAYYEWEITEVAEHRFSKKYHKKKSKLLNPEMVHSMTRSTSLKFKIALVAVIVMLMGSMTVLAIGALSEKANNFIEELFQKESEKSTRVPTKTEVYAMREEVLAGMTNDEIYRLRENIKTLNVDFEQKYLYDNCFEKWADSNDLYWEDINADDFIELVAELKESMKTDLLDADFNHLVNYMRMAKETHDVKYLEEVYHILHDMDYYLLRYGPEDVFVYMVDDSTVRKYYGVLEVYAR